MKCFLWNEQFVRFPNLAMSKNFQLRLFFWSFLVLLFEFLTYFSVNCFVVEEYEWVSRLIAFQQRQRSIVVASFVFVLY